MIGILRDRMKEVSVPILIYYTFLQHVFFNWQGPDETVTLGPKKFRPCIGGYPGCDDIDKHIHVLWNFSAQDSRIHA